MRGKIEWDQLLENARIMDFEEISKILISPCSGISSSVDALDATRNLCSREQRLREAEQRVKEMKERLRGLS